ncbi:uncharacterized protein BKA55DRAFT_261890 [Fusarium redolens]|uniref:Ubiquitin-like protease family profile domain-containing protein n=1 Tax=Fusarium redolens TaxID=48865 RepID=A0A9P9FX22_FUSRE|nr:uncharacterized protein BKA55DRAFT_261890 [Fusarium redolens]KAH7208414.1 hypothetical protein BKA55DRAFT_261890 [Fusarium redolens]
MACSLKRKAEDSLGPIQLGSSPARQPWYDEAIKARGQLNENAWLSDDSMDLLIKLIVSEAPDANRNSCHIVDTQLIKVGEPLPPFPANKAAGVDVVLIPLYFPRHWTLAAVDLTSSTVLFYDPMAKDGGDERLPHVHRLCHWVSPQGEAFGFRTMDGPQQVNSHSCGYFVLNAIRWLLGSPLPASLPAHFDQPKEQLLSLLDTARKAPAASPIAQTSGHQPSSRQTGVALLNAKL